jgi:hypothetical protein
MKKQLGFVTLTLLLLTGCKGSNLVNAKGRLTYKGQPVPSTYVTFWPEKEGLRPSTGLTDDGGNFTLRSSRTDDGVLLGKHTVSFRYFVDSDEKTRKIPPKASSELQAAVAKYGDAKTSPFHYEITGSGQFIDIKLESGQIQ